MSVSDRWLLQDALFLILSATVGVDFGLGGLLALRRWVRNELLLGCAVMLFGGFRLGVLGLERVG